MRLTIDIDQSEINDLTRALDLEDEIVKVQVEMLIEETTDAIYEEARKLVPVRTGTLRDSIKKAISKTEGVVSVEAFYARFIEIEYGNVKRPATPFLGPAFEKHIPTFIAGLK